MQEPNEIFRGLKLDQIRSIEKVEDGKFTISSSLVMAEGSFITSTVSEDPSAVVINEQLTQTRAELDKADDAILKNLSVFEAEVGLDDRGQESADQYEEYSQEMDALKSKCDEDGDPAACDAFAIYGPANEVNFIAWKNNRDKVSAQSDLEAAKKELTAKDAEQDQEVKEFRTEVGLGDRGQEAADLWSDYSQEMDVLKSACDEDGDQAACEAFAIYGPANQANFTVWKDNRDKVSAQSDLEAAKKELSAKDASQDETIAEFRSEVGLDERGQEAADLWSDYSQEMDVLKSACDEDGDQAACEAFAIYGPANQVNFTVWKDNRDKVSAQTNLEETKKELTEKRELAVTNLQGQLDFLLSGSTEEFDTLLEILNHINQIDVENDASLDAAIVSLNETIQKVSDESQAGDAAEAKLRTEAIADLEAVIDALSAKQSKDIADLTAASEAGDAAEAKARIAAIDALTSTVEANESDIEAKHAALATKQSADNAERAKEITDLTEASQAGDAAEAKAREAAIKALQDDVDQNEADADSAIADLAAASQAGDAAEAKAREAAIKALEDKVDTNEGDIEAKHAALATKQSTDNSDRIQDIADLTAASEAGDAAEAKAREAAIKALQDDVDQNEADADSAIDALATKQSTDNSDRIADIDAANAERAKAVKAIQDQIDFLLSGTTTDLDQIKELVEFIESTDLDNDNSLLAAVDAINTSIKELSDESQAGDEAESKARVAAVADLNALIAKVDEALQAGIDAEAKLRTEADAELQANLDSAIAKEEKARISADDTLQANIDVEAKARIVADDTLQANIDSLQKDVDTAISEAVQNSDFTQSSISLAGKLDGDVVSFKVPGNIGVILTFVDGLFVPSTTSYDEAANETTATFTMFFDAEETSKAHFTTVNFS